MIPVLPQKSALAREAATTARPKGGGLRVLAVLLLLAISAAGVAGGVIHQLLPARAASGDWPTYLHDPQRTAAGADTQLSAANAGQLALKWAFKTGGPIAASPTVVGGTVYVGSWDGYEYALDAASGSVKWKTSLGQTTAPCYPQLAGVSSAADVENGVVYVGGGDSYWYALDATTGNVLWKVFVGDNTKGWYNWASPLIYNGYAYIGTASVGDCPLIPGQLLQVSLSTHQVVNSFNAVPQGQTGGGIWTSPSLDSATNTIFVTTGTRSLPSQTLSEAVVALDASTLAVKSSWALPTSQETLDSDFGNTPILFNDAQNNALVGAINKNGYAYAFNRNNVAAGPVWTQTVALPGTCPQCGDASVSSGAFGNGTLFLAGGSTTINGKGYRGVVRALDPASGNFLWQHGESSPVIPALAYSNGLLVAGAGASLEVLDATSGTRLYSYTTGGYLYAAPSVANGQIYTGGKDNTVYAFGLGTPITPPPDPSCPSSWTCQDIGSPTPAGTETAAGSTWTVQAGGAGVGGTSDQLRLLNQTVSGDSQVSAQVVSQTATAGAAQAGVMVRQSNDAASPYYAVLLQPNNKLVAQYRLTFGGATTTVTLAAGASPPLYLEIQRVGDQVQAASSSDGTTYTLVAGSTLTMPLPASVLEGVALTSGAQGTSNTATYNAVSVGSPTTPPNPPGSPSPCPGGWSCSDIGNPITIGDQSLSSGTWTLKGSGKEINNYTDQFHFVWKSIAADGTMSAHITSQSNTNASAQAGVMLRQSTDAASPYYAAFVTPGNGIVVQYRPVQGLKTTVFSGTAGTVPTYLMVARSGSNYCIYTSSDGVSWSVLIGSCVTVSMSGALLAGLAVSSDNTGALSTVTYDTVLISITAPPPPNICPSGWNCADIGYPALPGSQYLIGGTWTVQGSGSDIWGTSDQFRFVSQSLVADGSVSAHITAQSNTDLWAKAGVMLRQTIDPGSPYYALLVTPGNGIVVQYRAAQGNNAQQSAALIGTVPAYLMVARSGNTYSAYTSSDGITWTLVAGSSVTLSSMSGSIMAGLVVTAHNGGLMGSATFDTVTFSNTAPPPPGCATGWTCQDIGNPLIAGGQSNSSGSWTIQGAGGDIWGTSDQFHLVSQPLAADGNVSAHITSQTNTDLWAKAGVMLRQSSDPASSYYAVFMTPGNGIVVQDRSAQGGTASQLVKVTGTVPTYLEVARTGSTYTAYTSSDGITWTPVAGSGVSLSMSGPVLAGMAVTSHNGGALSTATFDTVTFSNTAPPPPGCATGWTCADIGAPALAGSQSNSSGTWTIQGAGGDIWGTSDQLHLVSQSLAADGNVSAHITSQTNTSNWAKAGVMLRQSSDPGSMYYAVFVTPGNGIVVQYRNAQGGTTAQPVKITGTVPAYLLVARTGSTYTAYTSSDGITWTPVAGSGVSLSMSGPVLAGMAVTSHNTGALSKVTFDTVSVSTTVPPPPICPSGWSCGDIGTPALAGSQSLSGGTWTIQAGGNDIYGTTDQFHFVSKQLSADGSVSAHITLQTNTSGWAKAGVMLRQTTNPGSMCYAILVTPGNGIVVQYRKAQGGTTTQSVKITGTIPIYLAVGRTGSTYTAYTSSNGITWTPVAGSSVTLSMSGPVLAGMAVTSHNANVLGTVTFDTVSIGPTVP
jgi:outer membrane protein assembly factor BamB